MRKLATTICCLAVLASPSLSFAGEFEDAIKNGKAYINLRYRLETVEQGNFTENSLASTLRTRLGYETGDFKNFSALIEIEDVTVIGEDNYNDRLNGKTTRPTVVDPASTEINQAYIAYKGAPDTVVKLGRQVLNFDNQRFIGAVGWRQNNQTFDALTLVNASLEDTTAVYGYVTNVNRIFSDDASLGNLGTNAHLINISYDGFDWAKLTEYAYLLDVKDSRSLSSQTYGLRLKGGYAMNDGVKALYEAEYAIQKDYAENPNNYTANYFKIEPGIAFGGFTVKAGFESLEGDGTTGFATPLATGHAQNGWADLFLNTPANGLEDTYGSVFYKTSSQGDWLNDVTMGAIYHSYSAENGGADYGTEWNVLAKKNLSENYGVLVKYATYDADTFGNDVDKFWLQFTAKF